MPDAEIVAFDPHRRRRGASPQPRLTDAQSSAAPRPAPAGLTLAAAMESWELALQARRRQSTTIKSYRLTVATFGDWLASEGLPDDVRAVTTETIRRFLAHENGRPNGNPTYSHEYGQAKTTKPASAGKHYRNLRALFNWLLEEQEITAPSPVSKKDKPKVPTEEHPPLSDDEIRALLATCKARTLENLRDEAIIRLLIDSGPRRTGVAGIRYTPDDPDQNDVVLREYRVRITLKGGDQRWIPIGKNTARAIDRYIRSRARHRHAGEPWLWIGLNGRSRRFTGSGIYQMLKRRGNTIGIANVRPHRFRESSATAFLDAGGSETEAMYIYGWKSEAMPRHYTRATAKRRALDKHARLSPGDRF